MVNSLFILNAGGDVVVEKHWKGLLSRTICETFWLAVAKATTFAEVEPVIAAGRYLLLHVKAAEVWYVAVVEREESPLEVVEFLMRVDEIFKDYLKTVSENTIKDNFVCVYQLLEELMDNGMPFTTEPNQLRAMIPAPGSMMAPLGDMLSGDTGATSSAVPEGSLSLYPWRRVGVRYTSNDIKFDVMEEIEALVDVNGSVLSSEIIGEVMVNCRLSGMPDLTLAFRNPRIIEDAAFHPCVRFARWEQSRVLSFVPPDGAFKLMDFRVRTQINFPIYVKPTVSFMDGSGKITVTVSSKAPSDVVLESVRLTIPWDKCVDSCVVSSTQGKVEFNDRSKVVSWEIGSLRSGKSLTLSGNVHLNGGVKHTNPAVEVAFKAINFSPSGLKVESLAVHNVSYKPYKGVRALTKAGRFQYRT